MFQSAQYVISGEPKDSTPGRTTVLPSGHSINTGRVSATASRNSQASYNSADEFSKIEMSR